MQRFWIIWGVVTIGLAAYCTTGWFAGMSTKAPLELTPGNEIDLRIFRLFNYAPPLELQFQAVGCQQRPELGVWQHNSEWKTSGLLEFRDPGASVRLSAAAASDPPIIYEAMPLSGYCGDLNLRELNSDPPIAPGVWRWPPADAPKLTLHPGYNDVQFRVLAADSPLVGETVELVIEPALGFKRSLSGVASYFWFSFLWPVFAFVQAVWLAILLYGSITHRKQKSRMAT